MITVEGYLNYWQKNYPNADVPDDELTDEMQADATTTVDRANQILAEFGEERGITSGWRPRAVNALVRGAAPHSNHVLCRAIDIADAGGRLDAWINSHPDVLEEMDLWRESPDATIGWSHLQIVPYRSWHPGKTRTFRP